MLLGGGMFLLFSLHGGCVLFESVIESIKIAKLILLFASQSLAGLHGLTLGLVLDDLFLVGLFLVSILELEILLGLL